MRRAFADVLMKIAENNPRVVFLTGDLGYEVFDEFRDTFGPRYVNVGVAEAQLVCCAAGLAKEGWKPIVYSIGSFMTGRPFEQLRVSVSYPNLPVVVVGAGAGYTYADSGVTHHAAEDFALMSTLPNMTVVAPGDPGEVTDLMPQLVDLTGPSYIRIGRFGEPSYSALSPTKLGKARLVREGYDVAVVTTGDVASVAVEAVDRLVSTGIQPSLFQLHTVKPLDTSELARIFEPYHTLVVVEEHIPSGGLFSGLAAWRSTLSQGPKLIRLGPADSLVLGSPQRQELRKRINCDVDSIIETCRGVWL